MKFILIVMAMVIALSTMGCATDRELVPLAFKVDRDGNSIHDAPGGGGEGK